MYNKLIVLQPKESEGERIESTVPALGDMNNVSFSNKETTS